MIVPVKRKTFSVAGKKGKSRSEESVKLRAEGYVTAKILV